MKRREFIQRSAGIAGAGILAPAWLIDLKKNGTLKFDIGFQSWVVREMMAKDFAGTLKKMARQGYESVEMCSPAGYSKSGFGPLVGLSGKEMKGIIHAEGLSCTSSHFTFNELSSGVETRAEFAVDLGLSQMVVSSTGLREDASLDDWKKAADVMNKWGAITKKHGLQLGFHNHNLEFDKRDGQVIYDVLLDRLDASLVKMQFQVWVVSMCVKAADYFRKHPGRFISAHLADWSGKEGERTPIGQGKVDWPDFFEAGKAGGLKNIYVEMAPELLKESAAYLKSL